MTKTVAMFGSARPKETNRIYQQSQDAARILSSAGWTIATGGGPGLMQACNEGAVQACREGSTCSLGYSIYLPFEAETNPSVQEDHHHQTFFSRLEEFATCDAFIALPGGWGTLLEVLTVVQLLQVGHMEPKPLILVGGELHKIMATAEFMLKRSSYVGVDEGPFYEYAQNPVEAARLLLER